jgi:hypothetical protein
MTSREQVVTWARKQADDLQTDMRYEQSDGMYGGFWTVTDPSKKGLLMARAAAALEFLRQHTGDDSEWLRRAKNAYESNADRTSMESGVQRSARSCAYGLPRSRVASPACLQK